MFGWIKEESRLWRDLYAARTRVLCSFVEEAEKWRTARDDPGSEPDIPPEEEWRDTFRTWASSEESDHLGPRDTQEVNWAIDRLLGGSRQSGTKAEARALLSQHLVPVECWPEKPGSVA